MEKSRTYYTIKNTIYGYIASIITMVIGFLSRYFFVKYLGVSYLGVSGLFANVLGVLSFAELGFGTAINFSLYKPVAKKDQKTVISLLHFYKKVYYIIAGIVAGIGIVLTFFLEFIINNPGDVGSMNEIRLYFLVFLVNTVSTYFLSYKYSITNAEQKTYIQTNIEMAISAIVSIVQFISIIILKNYLLYLLLGLATNIILKAVAGIYLNRRYPVLKNKEAERLPAETLTAIKKNVKGLIFHRIGEISVYQTDNIIVSAFISLDIVGKISNYTMLIDAISKFTNSFFNSAIASFGNLIVLEDKAKRNSIFCQYRFIGFWVYGFCSIMLYILMTPFIEIVFGSNLIIDEVSIALMCLDFYFRGQRICLNNVKTAGGVFFQDRYVAFLQAAVNLVGSIIGVKLCGLPGVYLGTLVQGLLANMIKPRYVYRDILEERVNTYYIKGFWYFLSYLGAAILCKILKILILTEVTIIRFAVLMSVCIIVINLFFLATNGMSTEFKKLFARLKR